MTTAETRSWSCDQRDVRRPQVLLSLMSWMDSFGREVKSEFFTSCGHFGSILYHLDHPAPVPSPLFERLVLGCILIYYIKVIPMLRGGGGGESTREPLMNLAHHDSPRCLGEVVGR